MAGERTSQAISGVGTVVSTLILGVLGFTIPSVWTLSSDMGGIKVSVAAIEKRLDAIDAKVDRLENSLDGIDARLSAKDEDPTRLLAQAGLRSEAEFGAVWVNGKLYALPKTEQAATLLARSGAARESITPTTFGYVIGIVDAKGRLTVPTSAQNSTGSTGATVPTVGPKSLPE